MARENLLQTVIISKPASSGYEIPDMQRFVGIIFDEMKISSGLVFHKTSDLVGYGDLG